MHKVLVTGANGFVGSALCKALSGRAIPFVGAVRKAAIVSQYPVGDLTAATKWSSALAGCDVIIHLAARAHVMNDVAPDPLAAYRELNVAATVNLARQAVEQGVKRFVFVSSVKVNGERTTGKAFSAHDVPHPTDPYGQSKLEAECALREIAQASDLQVVIVRPPLVYGPGVRANFLRLMQLVRLNVPLPFGSVRNLRSMVALDNLVDFLILCAGHPAAAGQTFMVSDDEDLSLPDLIRSIASSMGRRPLLLPVPAGVMESGAALLGKSEAVVRLLGSLQVDVSDSKKLLGWRPQIRPAAGIEKTVTHFLATS